MQTLPSSKTILIIDTEAYSAPVRTGGIRQRLRRELRQLLTDTLGEVASDRELHDFPSRGGDRGDGWLVLIDPGVPKTRLVGPLIRAMTDGLRRYNDAASPAARLRVRLVLHFGEIIDDGHGPDGAELIHAFRLVESAELKGRLASSNAQLALIVSDVFYHHVIKPDDAGVNPAEFEPVVVGLRDGDADAWVWLGEHQAACSDTQTAKTARRPAPRRNRGPERSRDSRVGGVIVRGRNVIGGDVVGRDKVLGSDE